VRNRTLLSSFILLALLVAAPLVVRNNYFHHVAVMIFLFGTLGIAWNFIGGYGAQLSLGHSAFLAIGAYATVILLRTYHVTPLLGALVGAALAAVAAIVIGYPCFRLRGPYFTLSTIAFAEILRILLNHFTDFTGGAEGIPIPFRGEDLLNLQFYSKLPYYYLTLGFLALVFLLARYLERSRLGYRLAAIREDQDAAESLGIRSYRVKLITLVVSAIVTALAGALYAVIIGYIDPGSTAGHAMATEIAVVAIVGGIGTLWGPILGAAVVISLTEITNALLGSTRGGAGMVLYGVLLMVIVLVRPGGLVSFFRRSEAPGRAAMMAKGEVGGR
jgi:branched-chain amino acid transport system permease protein